MSRPSVGKIPSPARPSAPGPWGVASRAAAGILGGYALAALASVVVALAVRAPREDAVLAGTVPAFLVFAAAFLWAFAARTAGRAWLGVLAPGVLLGIACWALRATAS